MRSVVLDRLDEAFLKWQFRHSMSKQLAFLEDLFRLMADGVPLSECLILVGRVANSLDRRIARWMLRKLDEGGSILEAMTGIFRQDVVAAVAATYATGKIAESGTHVLERLREQWESRRGVVGQLVRPLFYLAISLGLYALFSSEVWPSFLSEGGALEMPPMAMAAHQVGLFILAWWEVLLIGLAVAAATIGVALRNWANVLRRLADRVWPLSLYRGLWAANSLEELGTLMVAGEEVGTALEAVKTYGTRYSRMYLERMERRLEEGYNLSDMLDVGFLSNYDMARLKVLAEHQGLRTTIMMTGAASRRATLSRIRTTAQTLDVAILSLVALSFAFLIGSVYLTAGAMQGAVAA